MSDRIILWSGGRPVLYCIAEKTEGIWHVVNGRWALNVEGQKGTDIKFGNKMSFEAKTVAPSGGDYNDVMNNASLSDEHIPWDAPHPDAPKPNFSLEDEIAF